MIIDLSNWLGLVTAVITVLGGVAGILAGAYKLFRGAVTGVVEDQLKTSDGRSVVAVVEDQVRRLVGNSELLGEMAKQIDQLADDVRGLRIEHQSLGERVARLETYVFPPPATATGTRGWFK